MGIKGKVLIAVGTGLVLAIAGWLGLRKEEDERSEKIQGMIRDVDLKEPEKKEEVKEEPKTVEELSTDVDEMLNQMDIDDIEDEPKAKTFEQIEADYQNMRNVKQAILDRVCKKQEKLEELTEEDEKELQKKQEEWQKQKQAKEEENWKNAVQKAIEQKDFHKLENLFDRKYAGGPWHPSPASVFGDARQDNVITDELYHEASEYFGRLWCYSGD